MSNENEKKYCVTIKTSDIEIMVILPMTEEIRDMIDKSSNFAWVFEKGAVQICVDKRFVCEFTIQPVQ